MASLQIPFSRWDWPNSEAFAEGAIEKDSSSSSNHPDSQNSHKHGNSHHKSHSLSPKGHHVADITTNCSNFTSKSITAASLSGLTAMLLDGQAVLAHQTSNAIWLFIGLSNGTIWKWSIYLSNPNDSKNCYAELVMTAHKSPIKDLAMSKYRVDYSEDDGTSKYHMIESLVSVDEAGELAVWNCHDGRCLLHNLRATASVKSAGYPNSISISPNYEFCILSGYSDKLVVLRLATLEIVHIVDVSSNRIPRWTRSAGFLLQDDPNLLLDYLTLNFNSPANESLTARQFDPKIGNFVSPACSILPPTIPKDKLEEFSSCHLLTCSRANPGLAALVTRLKHVWLIDFLSGDYVQFSLDFEIDGVEFVRADLLLVWSKTGKLAFYNVFIQSKVGLDSESDVIKRSRSPILGHVVRKLDIKSSFSFGNRFHLIPLEVKAGSCQGSCASLLWIETIQCPQRRSQVSLVKIEFDSECPDRTVSLYREQDLALNLLFNQSNSDNKPTNPVTCTISNEPHWLVHGHVDGRVSVKSILGFFANSSNAAEETITPSLEDIEPSFSTCPITALVSSRVNQTDHFLISAGDSQGQLQFWELKEKTFKFLGASRCHIRKIIGISEKDGIFYSWSADGVVAMYKRDYSDSDGIYRCVHLFHPPQNNLELTGLYWRKSLEFEALCLLLVYRSTNSTSAVIYTNWDITNGSKLPDLNDSTYLETLSISDTKIQIEGLNETSTSTSKSSISYRSIQNSQLFGGIVSILGNGKQWPDLTCHSIMIDIRLLARHLKSIKKVEDYDNIIVQLARRVLSQFLAWGSSTHIDSMCHSGTLKLSPNSEMVRYGLLGANGNISLILNPAFRDRFWTLSPTVTASLQLSIILLLESLPRREDDLETTQLVYSLVSFYAAQIGNEASCDDKFSQFKPPALSFISKFWQDPDEAIQNAARILFSTTFARLTPNQRKVLIDYWNDYLPHGGNVDSRSVHRSAIILGILGVQEPDILSRSTKKHVAESLVSLLLDGKRNIFRLAAVELIGRGYGIWSPFIHGASIFKLLHSWLIQLYGGDEQFYQTTLKSLIHILTTPEASDLNLSDSGCGGSVTSESTISRKSSGSNMITSTNTNSPLIIWLTELLCNREISLIERKCSVELIKNLSSFKPIIFEGNESLLVEVLMKLAPTSNPLFEELNTIFGVISLHRGTTTTKLAVALPDNSIAIYDLKTGLKITNLQGHVYPCTLVAFNPNKADGKQLITYSVREACVRWWNTSTSTGSSGGGSGSGSGISGLFSSFTGGHGNHESSPSSLSGDLTNRPGIKPIKITIVQPELTDAIDCIPTGSVFKLNPINLNWDSKGKLVEFRVGNLQVQSFSIPN